MPIPAARRELGRKLRELRADIGLTTREAAVAAGCSQPQITRVETASRACGHELLERLLEAYRTDEGTAQQLRELRQNEDNSDDHWWDSYADVIPAGYADYIALEDAASEAIEYQPLVVPGLVQTPRYAYAVTSGGLSAESDDRIDLLTEVRLTRQARLTAAQPLKSVNLMTEAALRFECGGRSVLVEQLQHLKTVARRSNVEVRVVPYSTAAFGAYAGGFTLFRFEDGTPTTVIENSLRGHTSTEVPRDVQRFERLARRLAREALDERASLSLIDQVLREIT